MVRYSAENINVLVKVTLTSGRMYSCTLIYFMSYILLYRLVYNWEVI